ncbi:MAG: lipid-A-disaccharide synthase [Candidatus Omnitrophota bacterium]|jgi:lipid-A-disaccharide synthase
MKKIFIITGESSGDIHGANLFLALQKVQPELEIHAMGSDNLKACHPKTFIDVGHVHATGIVPVLKLLPQFLKLFKDVERQVAEVKPDLIIFIDNPGFNLRLAKKFSKLNIPMIYYICPQVWAWKQKRIHLMRRLFKKCLVIFKFEEEFYKKHNCPATFVGHPIKDMPEHQVAIPDTKPITNVKQILILPGSRTNELHIHQATLIETVNALRNKHPELIFKVLKAPALKAALYKDFVSNGIELVEGRAADHIQQSHIGIASSGTVTLECAVHHLPIVIVYKMRSFDSLIMRPLIKTKYIGLPNILANKEIVPELVQENFTTPNITSIVNDWLEDGTKYEAVKSDLKASVLLLGEVGACDRAADEILTYLA